MHLRRFASKSQNLKAERTPGGSYTGWRPARPAWLLLLTAGMLIMAGIAGLALLSAPVLAGALSITSVQRAQAATSLQDSGVNGSATQFAPLAGTGVSAALDCSPDWAASPGPNNNAENDLSAVAAAYGVSSKVPMLTSTITTSMG